MKHDSLQRFLFEHANIRGEIAYLNAAYQTIMKQHPYPPAIRRLLGEALVSCLLLAGSIKFQGEISLQFHGDENLPLLLAQCDHELQIRGFAKYKEEGNLNEYHESFMQGKMVLTINQYNQPKAYQSVVPIRSVSMGENVMYYFAQSEQISSRVWLAVNEHQAAGMLLQLMPGQDTAQKEEFWEYAVQLGQTISEDELLSLDNETILHRLYHETDIRLFEPRTVRFHCRCSREKMKQALTILGEEDLKQLLKEREQVEITCEFCNQQYVFDAIDVAMLFHK
ncbi:Hsp33 family molecular chaperone HslO [Legionella londiniensis]